MNRYGIVVIGYKNIKGIERLLDSLSKVDFCGEKDITLIISIDFSGDDSVEQFANSYEWMHGEKHVIAYSENLGLQKHILSCGNYMTDFDLFAIAVLEDDIYVSPEMYKYMKSAIDYYKNSSKIAGISLYKHEYNIYAKHPFYDYCDYGDTFFVQYAMSWGQVWLREQWEMFLQWLKEEKWKEMDKKSIPANILKWNNSWLKYHILYCIDRDLYFVYPRISLTTDFSDVGAHNKSISTAMQVKLCMHKDTEWKYPDFEQTKAVYDAFFENKKLAEFFNLENIEIDLYGVKKYKDSTRYVVTSKILPNEVIKSWGLYLRPIEANIFLSIPGEEIFLYDLFSSDTTKHINSNRDRIFEYDLKGVNIVCLENFRFCISFMMKYLKIKINGIKKGLKKK